MVLRLHVRRPVPWQYVSTIFLLSCLIYVYIRSVIWGKMKCVLKFGHRCDLRGEVGKYVYIPLLNSQMLTAYHRSNTHSILVSQFYDYLLVKVKVWRDPLHPVSDVTHNQIYNA